MHRDLSEVQPYKIMYTEALRGMRPPPMVIDAFLATGGVMGLTSYPGVGKTWLTLEVMRAVVTGTPFLGRYRVAQPGPVLYVGSDASIYDYARQWCRLTHGQPDDLFSNAHFLLQSSFMFDAIDEVDRLVKTSTSLVWDHYEDEDGTPEAFTSVNPNTGEIDEYEVHPRLPVRDYRVIIFDTLSRLCRANQNDNTEMENVFRNIRHIAESTGAACILLHHNSKPSENNDGSDWRGAMSQIGALDSWVHLIKPKKQSAPDGSLLVGATFKKFRGITPPDLSFRMDVGNEETARLYMVDEAATVAQKMGHDPLAEALTDAVRKAPGLTAAGYRDALWQKFENEFKRKDQFGTAIHNRLRTLVTTNRLTRTGEGRETTYEVVATES